MGKRKRILTGLTPSGHFTIGNYFGSLKPLTEYLKDGHEVFIFVADLHGLSIPNNINSVTLKQNTIELLLILEALGLHNGKKNCYVYIQSHHKNHALLGFIIQFFSNVGELERMTQFKDKRNRLKSQNKTIYNPTGLLTYPTLMAADILLYSPDIVAVGNDQKQHIELTKNLCNRINTYLKRGLLNMPSYQTPTIGSRIMSLSNPNRKMSKSDPDTNASIYLLDNENEITLKIKKAKTDSENMIKKDYENNQLGIKNLMQLHTLATGIPEKKLVNEINKASVPYKLLKSKVSSALISETNLIRNSIKRHILSSDISPQIFENYIRNNPSWYPSFIHNSDWKRKNKEIEEIGNALMLTLLNKLGLNI